MDYSIFPYWMGISNFGELITGIMCCVLLFCIYILFGYWICPRSLKSQSIRALYILFWPVVIIIAFLLFPFILLYELSKPSKIQDKEINEWIKTIKY